MIYQRPFVTSRFTAYAGDSITRRLSLAVTLVDAFTGQPPETAVDVFLKERRDRHQRGEEPIRNRSGYYCFLDLSPGAYTLITEPDPIPSGYFLQPPSGGSWTFEFEQTVDIPLADPLAPVVVVTLSPHTGYAFPDHATLVRGRVVRGADPVTGAEVTSTYSRVDPDDFDNSINQTVGTQTDSNGDYVLFFKAPSASPQNIVVTAAADNQQASQPVVLEEGKTAGPVTIQLP